MIAEVFFACADGTHQTHRYEATKITIQGWDGGRAKIAAVEDGVEVGSAHYSHAVYIRRGVFAEQHEKTD